MPDKTIEQIVASLSEKDAKALLVRLAGKFDILSEHLIKYADEPEEIYTSLIFQDCVRKVRSALRRDTASGNADYYGSYDLYETPDAIRQCAQSLIDDGYSSKALDLADFCEDVLIDDFHGECFDDLSMVYDAAEQVRTLVLEQGTPEDKERLFSLYASMLLDCGSLAGNLITYFDTPDYLERKLDLFRALVRSLGKNKLDTMLGQEALCQIILLMEAFHYPAAEIAAFENRYLMSGMQFTDFVRRRRQLQGNTSSAIDILEHRRKTPQVCRELIDLYKKENQTQKAVETLKTLIVDVKALESVDSELEELKGLTSESRWQNFTEALLDRDDLPADTRLCLLRLLDRKEELAALVLTTDRNVFMGDYRIAPKETTPILRCGAVD